MASRIIWKGAISFGLIHVPVALYPGSMETGVDFDRLDKRSMEGVIGIARVVMHNKEQLAALIPSGAALILNTLRWQAEIRPLDERALPPGGKSAPVADAEPKRATQRVDDMTAPWQRADYAARFTDAVQALVKQRAEAGRTEKVESLEDIDKAPSRGKVVDLTELLKRSLGSRAATRAAPAKKTTKTEAPTAPKATATPPKAATKTTRKPAARKRA